MQIIQKVKCLEEGWCEGTKVTAKYLCGGSFDVDNGIITSPLNPGNYVNSEACVYGIV